MAEISVSDDHLIVAQRVTQNITDNDSLEPMVDQVKQRCRAQPGAALADSGFFSINNLKAMEQRNTMLIYRILIWRGLLISVCSAPPGPGRAGCLCPA